MGLILVLPVEAQLEHPFYPRGIDRAEVLEGEVTVDVIRGRGIAVGLDVDEPADGLADRLFILEYVGLIPSELPLYLPRARVVVKADHLVVAELDGPTVVGLFLREQVPRKGHDRLHSQSRREWQGEDETYTYVGIGLVDRAGSWSGTSWTELGPRLLFKDSICRAGGVGSTACSVECANDPDGGCSATCGEGYHACCNCRPPECGCKRNSGSGDGGGGAGGGLGGGTGGGENCSGNPWCPPECVSCGTAY